MRKKKDPAPRSDPPDVRFRPVTVETLKDFADFRNANPVFGACSCMRWRTHATPFSRLTAKDRAVAFDTLVGNGVPVGVLAYQGGIPIGWCSVAPRNTLPALKARWHPPGTDITRIWAVTCFYVDPRYRREGVSVRLLRAAVEYARAEGAKVVEGYPVEPGNDQHASAGFASTFRGAGFRDASFPGWTRRVMCNVLR
jgi:GNAT superfamily N-acetyltransferase